MLNARLDGVESVFTGMSLEALVACEPPHVHAAALEYARYLVALNERASAALAAGVGAVPGANGARSALLVAAMENAEHLADPSAAIGSSGWTLLMCTWAVAAKLGCLVPEPPEDDDDSDSLERGALLVTPGGITDVPYYALSELRMALELLCARLLVSLEAVDGALVAYVRALERRAYAFLARTAAPEEYDVSVWSSARDGAPRLSTNGVAAFAWSFVLLRRHLLHARSLVRAATFSNELAAAHVSAPVGARLDTAAVVRFLDTYVRGLSAEDHENAFMALGREHQCAVGALEIHSYVHGMGGLEAASVSDIYDARAAPEAVEYREERQFRRTLEDWYAGFKDAEALGDRARDEYALERASVLYAVRTAMRSHAAASFDAWFLAGTSGAEHCSGATAASDVRCALIAGAMPFLAQSLGGFVVVCPEVPETEAGVDDGDDDDVRARLERAYFGLAERAGTRAGVVVYDTRTSLFSALAVWARLVLEGWRGRVHHAPAVRLAPLLRALLGYAAR